MFFYKGIMLFCLIVVINNVLGQSIGTEDAEKIDASKIAGQSKEYIANYLGEPIEMDTINQIKELKCPCPQYSYAEGLVTVIYNNELADWVYIYTTIDLIDIKYRNEYADVTELENGVLIKTYTK